MQLFWDFLLTLYSTGYQFLFTVILLFFIVVVSGILQSTNDILFVVAITDILIIVIFIYKIKIPFLIIHIEQTITKFKQIIYIQCTKITKHSTIVDHLLNRLGTITYLF